MDEFGRHPDYYTYRYIHPSGRYSLRLALSNRAAWALWGLGALVVLAIAILLAFSLAWGQQQPSGEIFHFPPTTNNTIIAPSRDLVYWNDGQAVVTIHPDGSVDYGKGFTAGSAARDFWNHLGSYVASSQCLPMREGR